MPHQKHLGLLLLAKKKPCHIVANCFSKLPDPKKSIALQSITSKKNLVRLMMTSFHCGRRTLFMVNQESNNPLGILQSIYSLLHMQGPINGYQVCVLHDDRSSHDIISKKLIRKLQLHTSPSLYKVKSTF